MEGDLGPEDVRGRKFELVRRGYDRAQVDRFHDDVAVSMAATITELAELREKLGQAGMTEVPDLKAELDAVSSQVSEVLASASEAAEGMRSRASEDAARWRAEADKEARGHRTSATKDAEQARKSAWEMGTLLLAQADAEVKQALEDARQDALFIRAEAEREALRLTGNARRDREEWARQARTEAERLLIDARAESERILDAARQSAQNAQERARALEQRRTELMHELEAARLSIGQLEQEIDSRREALHAAADAPDAGVRVIKTGSEVRTEWRDGDASVRIVPAMNVPVDEPVDADAFVAEVAELQAGGEATAEPEEQQVDEGAGVAEPSAPEEAPDEPPPSEDELLQDEDLPAAVAEPEPAQEEGGEPEEPEPAEPETAEPETAEPETAEPETAEPETAEPETAEPETAEPETAEPETAEPETAEPETAVVGPDPAGIPEGIDDLFAELRTADDEAPDDDGEPAVPPPRATEAELPAPRSSASPEPLDASAAVLTRPAEAAAVASDPFELRDRVLLPIENRTLRSVKRKIVDLQNRVLEELRLANGEWEPDRSMFVAAVSDDVARMNAESFVAGHAAAAELVGASVTPPPEQPAGQAMVGEFVDSLVAAVSEALTRARTSGGGSRQVSAAVGRIFRAWRTDEAERRLRRAGYTAYNGGLLGAYQRLDVERVVAVAPGTACGACPAGTGTAWAPGDPLPAGSAMPPAQAECRATIVPAT